MKIELKLKIVAGLSILTFSISSYSPLYEFNKNRPIVMDVPYYCSDNYHQETFDKHRSPVMHNLHRSAIIQLPIMNIPMQYSNFSVIVNEIKEF